MKVSIICVGKIKEAFYRDAIEEYKKRLTRYCNIEIVQVEDDPTKEDASDTVTAMIKAKEGQRILSKIPQQAFVCTLEIGGKKMDSVRFSDFIEKSAVQGRGHLVFVIGGSLGLDKAVSDRADYKLSFSDMTFPHQLMRVILLEQVYRGFRILNKEPYHK